MARNTSSGGLSPFYTKIDRLTQKQKTAILILSIILLLAFFIGVFLYPKYAANRKIDKEYDSQEVKLAAAKKNAAQLKEFKEKMVQAEQNFQIAAKKLPAKEEIPSLLAMISNSGQRVGLEFELFEPKSERNKGFYVEIPVAIQITGGYHQTAQFFDRIARLPRVVNIRNITMEPQDQSADLNTACTAVTYKFIDKQNNISQ